MNDRYSKNYKPHHNPAVFWGNDITTVQNSVPVWDPSLGWAYNTETTDLFLFSESEWKLFRHHSKESFASDVPASALSTLSNLGIFVSARSPVPFLKEKIAEVWLQANHFCNLACPGCSTGMDVSQEKGKRFELSVFEPCLKRIVRDAKEKGFERLKVKIAGGEPTLNGIAYVDGVARACRDCSDDAIEVYPVLLTNGIAFSREFIDMLVRNRIRLSVSTDPARTLGKGKTPALPIVLNNIALLKRRGGLVSAQLTVSSLNASRIAGIYEQLSEFEVSLHFSVFRPQTRGQFKWCDPALIRTGMMGVYAKAFDRMERKKFFGNIASFDYLDIRVVKQSSCGAGKTYVVLDTDGSVYSCHESIRTKKNAGNLYTEDGNVFDLIDRGHAVQGHERDAVVTDELLEHYPFVRQGGLGCPWMVEKLHGTFAGAADPVMEIYNELAPILIALNAKYQRSKTD